jgi:hypothetical protein
MAYVTMDNLLGTLPAEWRGKALQDGPTGATLSTVWTELYNDALDEVRGALNGVVMLPPENPAENTPEATLLSQVKTAMRGIIMRKLFERRMTPPENNPHVANAEAALKQLRKIGDRITAPAPGSVAPPGGGSVRVITAPSRVSRR